MYIVKISLFFLFLPVSFSWARITDGKISHKIEKNQIVISVDKGFHINEKAPMTFKFFVCDDKNTACEEHEIKPKVSK